MPWARRSDAYVPPCKMIGAVPPKDDDVSKINDPLEINCIVRRWLTKYLMITIRQTNQSDPRPPVEYRRWWELLRIVAMLPVQLSSILKNFQ